MRAADEPLILDVYATCPPYSGDASDYLARVTEVARWSEEAGCRGILIYADNAAVDPWLVAQSVVAATQRLWPLVAVQPVYMHPYTVAKMVSSIALLHGRRVALNMVSGGFKNDLAALGDDVSHDDRYARLVEYTSIVKQLLQGERVSCEGAFYKVGGLRLAPSLPPSLMPEIFVAGSSPAGLDAAIRLGAVAVKYPRPPGEEESSDGSVRKAVRVAVVARGTDAEAWEAAHAFYPPDRKGELQRQVASKVSDSVWHRDLAERQTQLPDSPYWLFPFQTYKTMCPCLVGSYERVGEELGRYAALGSRAFILDVPRSAGELGHVRAAFQGAGARLAS